MLTTEQEQGLKEVGQSAYEGIAEMVAALECDYDRLAELREERADLVENVNEPGEEAIAARQAELVAWDEENDEELQELATAAGECESREDAEQRIQEDPLSVEVRSGWTAVGEPLAPEEFNILLGTGGPAVRIVGEPNQYGEPDRAWLETQDWFTPWTRYFDADQDVLLTYCRQFYFSTE